MIRHLSEIPWKSIRVKLVLGLLSITLPLIVLLIYNNSYSVNVIHNQVAMSSKNLISLYMKQIDDQLSEAERHMMGLAFSEWNVQAMGEPNSDDEYAMAKSSVSRRLSSDLSVYPYIDGFFVYSITKEDIVDAFKGSMDYMELSGIRKTMKDKVMMLAEQPGNKNDKWTVEQINGTNHIVRLFRSGDIYIGSWVRVETLLEPLREMQTGASGALLIVNGLGQQLFSTRKLSDSGLDFTKGFEHYYLSGTHKDYLVVGDSSTKGDFSLASVIPDKQILENLPYLNKVSTIVIFIAILMVPLSLWSLRRVLLLPLRRMMTAMRLIGEGNFNTRIETAPLPDEFQLVNRTFNQMISQIEELKINVYEEQLNKHKAELKHLQLQINPHFFMNSFNILYSLAQVKNYELIQEMTLCLVHYFRYMFQSSSSFASLKDELQHVSNYLRIQQLRFPYQLTCEIRVPEFLLMTPVPPLLLQTFVENTIKHTVKMDEPITLTIEAFLDDLAEEPMVNILIRDTGSGFSHAALESIRLGKLYIDEGGEHIGIWNAQERLRLQYGDLAKMECYNDDPQGAVVELVLPLNPPFERKEWRGDAAAADRR
jgi:two-component system sensor histidine kinase YesM